MIAVEHEDEERRATAGSARPDVTELLVAEHRALLAMLARLRRDLGAPDARTWHRELHRLLRRVVEHEVAEQRCVYPILGSYEGGPELRRAAAAEEREVMVHLARVARRQRAWPSRAVIGRELASLAIVLESHFDLEEDHVFPNLVRLNGLEKRQMMGAWLRHARVFAPTRPHPHVRQGLVSQLSLVGALAVVDRSRDRLSLGRYEVRHRERRGYTPQGGEGRGGRDAGVPPDRAH